MPAQLKLTFIIDFDLGVVDKRGIVIERRSFKTYHLSVTMAFDEGPDCLFLFAKSYDREFKRLKFDGERRFNTHRVLIALDDHLFQSAELAEGHADFLIPNVMSQGLDPDSPILF